MCQYSSEDGFANDWHLRPPGHPRRGRRRPGHHRGHRGPAGGRISPQDLGIVERRRTSSRWRAVTRFIVAAGARGRHPARTRGAQGQHRPPWEGAAAVAARGRGLDSRSGPTHRPFARPIRCPRPLDVAGIATVVGAFATPRRVRADAGFRRHRGPRRARLPAPRVPLAAEQSADRRAMAARSRTASGSARGRATRCARSGPSACPSSSASRPPTGREGGWDIDSRSSSRGC